MTFTIAVATHIITVNLPSHVALCEYMASRYPNKPFAIQEIGV